MNDPQSLFLDAHPEYSDDSYVSNNLAILHVYFEAIQFMRKERSELYGITDFFSNIGGLGGGGGGGMTWDFKQRVLIA